MIIDKLENASIYQKIHPKFEQVFNFIANTNMQNIELGSHEIAGTELFVNVMEYTTQDADECKSETHKKYIDIQFMVFGEEFIGYEHLTDQVPTTPYNEEGDCMFYTLENLPKLPLKTNHFAIFFPDDVHKTMIRINEPKNLRKAVFKIKI